MRQTLSLPESIDFEFLSDDGRRMMRLDSIAVKECILPSKTRKSPVHSNTTMLCFPLTRDLKSYWRQENFPHESMMPSSSTQPELPSPRRACLRCALEDAAAHAQADCWFMKGTIKTSPERL